MWRVQRRAWQLAMTSMARLWDVGKTEPIKVGKASPTEGTLPSSVYIILKYVDDFAAAASEWRLWFDDPHPEQRPLPAEKVVGLKRGGIKQGVTWRRRS